jgi:hypothetical protein
LPLDLSGHKSSVVATVVLAGQVFSGSFGANLHYGRSNQGGV